MNILDQYEELLTYPESRVYCYSCGFHLYNMDKVPVKGEIKLSMLHPSTYFISEPTSRRCPICGQSFIGPNGELLAETIRGRSVEKNRKNAIGGIV
jgi:ribosomal protein S27E